MIRTLLIIAAVSFVFCVGCLSGAMAVAGGPFNIGPGLNFERTVKVCRTVYVSGSPMRKCRWTSRDGADGDEASATDNAAAINAAATDAASANAAANADAAPDAGR